MIISLNKLDLCAFYVIFQAFFFKKIKTIKIVYIFVRNWTFVKDSRPNVKSIYNNEMLGTQRNFI